jgi:hypothetical protein
MSKLNPTAVQSYNGNITVSGGGVSLFWQFLQQGKGVNSKPLVTTGNATSLRITLPHFLERFSSDGCSAVTVYGFEYSTTNNFPEGTGTQSVSTNIVFGVFSSDLSGTGFKYTLLLSAFATNAGGTAYGALQNFTNAFCTSG